MQFEPSNHWNPRSDKPLLSTFITWHWLFCYNNSKRDRTCSILKSPGAETAPNPDLYFLSSQWCDRLKPLAVRKLCPGREPRPSLVEFTSWVSLTPGSKSSTLSRAMPKNGFVLWLITADRPFCCQLQPELGILPYILSGLCSRFFFFFKSETDLKKGNLTIPPIWKNTPYTWKLIWSLPELL